jgi:hypothetical protein
MPCQVTQAFYLFCTFYILYMLRVLFLKRP